MSFGAFYCFLGGEGEEDKTSILKRAKGEKAIKRAPVVKVGAGGDSQAGRVRSGLNDSPVYGKLRSQKQGVGILGQMISGKSKNLESSKGILKMILYTIRIIDF